MISHFKQVITFDWLYIVDITKSSFYLGVCDLVEGTNYIKNNNWVNNCVIQIKLDLIILNQTNSTPNLGTTFTTSGVEQLWVPPLRMWWTWMTLNLPSWNVPIKFSFSSTSPKINLSHFKLSFYLNLFSRTLVANAHSFLR